MVVACPSDNTEAIDQEKFWNGEWDAHKIGWIVSGAAAAVTCLISAFTIYGHLLHYNKPLEQRQIVRILLFAPVFAVVSFFSYRFFRVYTYYELAEVVWEAVAIAAFLMLLLQYIGESVVAQVQVFAKKDKKKLPMPLCCLRYRPSKAYFLFFLKWSVVQYVIIRPVLSITGIVLEYYHLLCNSSLSPMYGHVYLLAIDFVSISIALYALIVLYGLVNQELRGRKPLAKFATLKVAVFFTFYQSFVFSLLEDHGVIKATEYWTATNVASGLNALCTSLEMVIVAGLQVWAFPWTEYRVKNITDGSGRKLHKKGRTNAFKSLLHALNFSDFIIELWHSLRFVFDRMRGKEYTRQDAAHGKFDFLIFQGGKQALDAANANAEKLGGTGAATTSVDNLYAHQQRMAGAGPGEVSTAFGFDDDTVAGGHEEGMAMHSMMAMKSDAAYGANASSASRSSLLPASAAMEFTACHQSPRQAAKSPQQQQQPGHAYPLPASSRYSNAQGAYHSSQLQDTDAPSAAASVSNLHMPNPHADSAPQPTSGQVQAFAAQEQLHSVDGS